MVEVAEARRLALALPETEDGTSPAMTRFWVSSRLRTR
jgi:hypothetical protein